MPLVVTKEKKSLSHQSTQDHLLRSFRMRSLTPSFPEQKKKQFLRSELAWKKCGNKCKNLPDDPDEEYPWHEQQED